MGNQEEQPDPRKWIRIPDSAKDLFNNPDPFGAKRTIAAGSDEHRAALGLARLREQDRSAVHAGGGDHRATGPRAWRLRLLELNEWVIRHGNTMPDRPAILRAVAEGSGDDEIYDMIRRLTAEARVDLIVELLSYSFAIEKMNGLNGECLRLERAINATVE